jgi:hypothetical protein
MDGDRGGDRGIGDIGGGDDDFDVDAILRDDDDDKSKSKSKREKKSQKKKTAPSKSKPKKKKRYIEDDSDEDSDDALHLQRAAPSHRQFAVANALNLGRGKSLFAEASLAADVGGKGSQGRWRACLCDPVCVAPFFARTRAHF